MVGGADHRGRRHGPRATARRTVHQGPQQDRCVHAHLLRRSRPAHPPRGRRRADPARAAHRGRRARGLVTGRRRPGPVRPGLRDAGRIAARRTGDAPGAPAVRRPSWRDARGAAVGRTDVEHHGPRGRRHAAPSTGPARRVVAGHGHAVPGPGTRAGGCRRPHRRHEARRAVRHRIAGTQGPRGPACGDRPALTGMADGRIPGRGRRADDRSRTGRRRDEPARRAEGPPMPAPAGRAGGPAAAFALGTRVRRGTGAARAAQADRTAAPEAGGRPPAHGVDVG
jgi:hypothetical protein